MMTGVIYKAENVVTKKLYIGQTIQPLEKRIRCHLSVCRSGKHNKFYNSIRKHGEYSIVFSEIAKISATSKYLRHYYLNILEDMYIENYETMVNGYNSVKGGLTRIVSDETRDKLSKALKGRAPSKATLDAAKKARTGKPMPKEVRLKIKNTLTGRKRPESFCKKLGDSRRGIKHGPMPENLKLKQAKLKSIGEYHTPIGVYTSSRSAASKLGMGRSAILKWCCTHNDKIISNQSVMQSHGILKKEHIGKSFRDIGYFFIPKGDCCGR